MSERCMKLVDWWCQPVEHKPYVMDIIPDPAIECGIICDLFEMDYKYKNGICSCEDRYEEGK